MKARALAGELVGTYGFVILGPGAGVVTGWRLAGGGLVAIAAANGIALVLMIAIFGPISGAHFNPAVTLSAWVGRKIRTVDALGYVVCQILGAIAAALTLRMVRPDSDLGTPALTVPSGWGMLAEGAFTMVLALVIWGTGLDERGPRVAALSVGVTVFVGITALGALTGGAFNPARYFGPAAVAGRLSAWWVYVLGPVAGATLASVLYTKVLWTRLPWARSGWTSRTPTEPHRRR